MMQRSVAIGVLLAGFVVTLLVLGSCTLEQHKSDQAVLGYHIFRGSCEGMPVYTPGDDVGVFISCNADRTEWSIRWSGDTERHSSLEGRQYLFTGDIRAQRISRVEEFLFEDGSEATDPDSTYLRTATDHDVLGFHCVVGPAEDGLDFVVSSGSYVVFTLDGNLMKGSGSYVLTPADIYIGADGLHPESTEFTIQNTNEQQ
jgi:hypothetical protein